ncbi:MAG: VanZ family protein [Candidatus Omnitrophica bacterium]|nr:VanZ family protein [Candidatus Omnitrophota bacterium]
MKIRDFFKYWFPVIAYCALIFIFSSMPKPPEVIPLFPHADKVLHFIEYTILGFLVIRALAFSNKDQKALNLRVMAITLAVLYALSDEFHQSFVPNRHADILDLISDSLGAFIGQMFLKFK